MAEILQTREFRQFRVEPRTPVIGGWIEGDNLADLDEQGLADLREALWTYGVLFGRGQHLAFDAMKCVALGFGDRLEEHSYAPTMADQGHPEVVVIRKLQSDKSKTTTDIWHHDVSARKHPNIMSILQADQVPFGADTMWSSMTSAYERLPDGLKQLFLNIDIDHDTLYLMLRHDFGDATMSPEKIANEMPKIPELQVRHQWEPGDVAIWDNFGTAHYGVSADIGDQMRQLFRVASWSEAVTPCRYHA